MTSKSELLHSLRHASEQITAFKQLVQSVPYQRKGILFSEMFFFWLCARSLKPHRILESGRARGQSTLVLSHLFPHAEIVSVEYDRDSGDVAVAAERLRDRGNVKQLFGDATRILPNIAKRGDIALIDGPKGYRGLRLALDLLRTGKLPLVFIHDTARGSKERGFLTKRMREAVFSDSSFFSRVARCLDADVGSELPERHRWTEDGAPAAGYGFSLACVPRIAERRYLLLKVMAVVDGTANRLLKR